MEKELLEKIKRIMNESEYPYEDMYDILQIATDIVYTCNKYIKEHEPFATNAIRQYDNAYEVLCNLMYELC